MKKRLLFAFMALATAVSGFALEVGQYVYTPTGRFKITGTNENNNSAFTDLTGWTKISATEETTLDAIFQTKADGYAAGINSVNSLVATATEGMYYTFTPASPTGTYIVSYKMKGTNTISIRTRTKDGTTSLLNVVRVQGNTAGTYGDATDEIICNKAEQLTDEWQTFNYAIKGDGMARTYFISFTGMNTAVEIADLQIAAATEVADLRLRDALVDTLNVFVNCRDWDGLVEDYELDANIEDLKALGDDTTPEQLSSKMATARQNLFGKNGKDGLVADEMDQFLEGNDKLGWYGSKIGNASKFGNWDCVPASRCNVDKSGGYPDQGHYVKGATWANGNPTNPMGVKLLKKFDNGGTYVFSIQSSAAVRENASQSWTVDDGMKPAIGKLTITKCYDVEGVMTPGTDAADIVVSVEKELEPATFKKETDGTISVVTGALTDFIASFEVANDGETYEISMMAWCKESHQALTLGSVAYMVNASLWGKTNSAYSQAELSYEADVREQITTGRTQITTATENLEKADMLWGKTALQDSLNKYKPEIEKYEGYTQEQIIKTFDEDAYNKANSTKNAEEGLLVFEVYDKATKHLIAANRTFNAVNDTLNSMQPIIDLAEATMAMRIYSTATGKADLQTAIDNSKGVLAEMKTKDYSEENADKIIEANDALNKALETFKGTIPAENITTIIALDFANGATKNAETTLYEVTGTNTVMSIENFSENTPTTNEAASMKYELGIDKSGVKELKEVLRVGDGKATATIPAKEYSTNILRVSMDYWFVRLTDFYNGFSLNDAEDTRVAGWGFIPYSSAIGSNPEYGFDDFGMGDSMKNFFVANTTGDDGSCANDNKTHIEAILDYGTKKMYLTSTTPNGIKSTQEVDFNGNAPATFKVLGHRNSGNAVFPGRRSWFDNLKIEEIKAADPTGIETIKDAKAQNGAIYNLAGQRVNNATKGIFIQNGKKFVIK